MTDIIFSVSMYWLTDRPCPANTLRNNDVVITSKQRHFDVITSKWRRFDVITTLLLRHVFRGWTRNSNVSHRVLVTVLFHNLLIRDFPLRRKQFTTSDWRVYQARKGHNSIISTHWYLWSLGNVHRKTGECFYHACEIDRLRRNGQHIEDDSLTYICFNGNV